LFAHAPGGARADFDLNTLFKFERRVMGSYSGSIAEQRQVFELLCDGRFDPTPLVSHQLPLDAFEQGLQLAFSQRALKILFTPRTGVT
jgi:threonine dehydrogenase-like Zn-dependent dehydrogenase